MINDEPALNSRIREILSDLVCLTNMESEEQFNEKRKEVEDKITKYASEGKITEDDVEKISQIVLEIVSAVLEIISDSYPCNSGDSECRNPNNNS